MRSAEPVSDGPSVGERQRVQPAGHGAETRWVVLTAVLVVLAWVAAVGWQRHLLPAEGLAAHQIDLALDLSAAEQGIYTDLQAVHEEWLAAGAALPPPPPASWAAQGWAPFADDLVAARRGRRQWQLFQHDGRHAYLGVPLAAAQGEAAPRLLLWRLPEGQLRPSGSEGASVPGSDAAAAFDVWLRPASDEGEARSAPPALEDAYLVAHGWLQVRTAAPAGAAGAP